MPTFIWIVSKREQRDVFDEITDTNLKGQHNKGLMLAFAGISRVQYFPEGLSIQ